ncbi:MAG: bifunctional 4-hydroxy-2-oxoglutarate aldolase/2-dehydro-3-deoxy-phosphogluconate aldolase [Anaerolineales bacterium]
MKKEETINIIRETGVIAIMRAQSSDQLIAAADAIKKGGVKAIEVTMTTPGALGVIAEAKERYGSDVIFGAGSVLDPETGRAAILAGADFVVSPILNLELVALCNRYGIPTAPGCYSPTEVLTGWEAGADFIKLVPASFGGPSLIKAILAPLPQVRIIPVGGVNLDTAADFIQKGAAALGVGSSLVNQKLLDTGDMDELTRRAVGFIEQVKKGRGL